ncbi:hypothetical protein Y1Q_0012027 [Alligator mississippiensis]|uniref:Uncharacterized protein n=1 Tax=Alligator mississippiensis TaxID=8496 RepID=A0A151P684_ALLMI|nr:hypothetical protein Y1Q_0012027 [Alligator mississippiensis]
MLIIPMFIYVPVWTPVPTSLFLAMPWPGLGDNGTITLVPGPAFTHPCRLQPLGWNNSVTKIVEIEMHYIPREKLKHQGAASQRPCFQTSAAPEVLIVEHEELTVDQLLLLECVESTIISKVLRMVRKFLKGLCCLHAKCPF